MKSPVYTSPVDSEEALVARIAVVAGDIREMPGVFANVQQSLRQRCGCGSPVVKVSDHGRHVMNSSPVPLKSRRVGKRYTLKLSRAQMSSRWCGATVRRGGASSGDVSSHDHGSKLRSPLPKTLV
ncbi:uncharacterized protein TNCV_645891 [Trichonephila clavipes]|nr:uncharacterized protein TNCV_645891 [Trichonephila clavipes]